MFSKLTVLTLLTAALTKLAAAAPPACVIGAVNTQSNPHDIAAVCKAQEVQDSINKNCGNAKEEAQKWFSEVCKGAGVTVASTVQNDDSKTSSLSSGSGSPSSSSISSSNTVPTNPSSVTNDQATRSSSSGGSESSPSATGGAPRLGMDAVGLLAVGAFGFVVAL